ncbi:MAG: hypothetical protein AB7T31_15465 [Gemmatimonadales bacterium]
MSDSTAGSQAGAIVANELASALERAFRELPTGSAESRLRHYCGRIWDVLRASDFAEAHRRSLSSDGGAGATGSALASCVTAVAVLVTEGVRGGEFVAVSPKRIARVLVSSLFARAHWCAGEVDPRLSGSCTRAVAETLEVLWPALGISAPGSRTSIPFNA